MEDEAENIICEGHIGKAATRPTRAMEFVNMNAVSQAERQWNRKVIRSTAMRSFRQKQRSQRVQECKENNGYRAAGKRPLPKPREDDPSDEGLSPGSTNTWSSKAAFSDVSLSMKTSLSSNSTDIGFGLGDSSHGSALRSPSPIELSSAIGPITPLGAGRIDPFRSISYDTGSPIHELIDHCQFHSSRARLSVNLLTLGGKQPSLSFGQAFASVALRGAKVRYPQHGS
jgi:hypothetical protein